MKRGIKNFTLGSILAVCACGMNPAAAQEAVVTGELMQWHKVTLTINGPEANEAGEPNPFADYRMIAIFRHPVSDTTLRVPGYFAADGNAAETSAASGNKWRAHLAPPKTGRWEYAVSFRKGPRVAVSDEPNAGTAAEPFDGVHGEFDIAPSNKTGRDFRARGLLEYVGETFLKFAGSGEYFLKCGADAPENFLAYRDFDGTFKNDGHKDQFIKSWEPHVKDWKSGDPAWKDGKGKGIIGALNYLAGQGMNAFSFLTLNIEGDDQNVFPYTDYDERLRMDVSRLDQWEIVFEHADKLGLFTHFKTLETENELLLDEGNLDLERRLYYRELIARFAHHLALNWNLGEEINNATTQQKKEWAEYFWNHDPYRHLIVIHNGANHYDLLGPEYKITGFSLQTNQPDFSRVHGQVINYLDRSKAAGKVWPVAVDEPGDASHALLPDKDNPDHDNARVNGLWGALLGGAWGLEWYFGYRHDHSDLTCEDWRSRQNFWDQCRHALQFFNENKIPYWKMANADSLIEGNGWCLAQPGRHYVAILKDGSSVRLDLSQAPGDFELRYFHPKSGRYPQEPIRLRGGRIVELDPAEAEPPDQVAWLRKLN